MRRPICRVVRACAVAVSALACDPAHSSTSLAPLVASPSSPSPGPTYPFTVSGVVTEYRGGPIADVLVSARPNFPLGNGIRTTRTDTSGAYRIGGLTEAIIISAEKTGYSTTGSGVFKGDRVVDLTMSRQLQVAAGDTLTATIWGDSEMNGEDWTGSNCQGGCELISVMTSGPGTLTARLRWSDPGNQLGVFISTAFFDGRGAHGSSPLEVSVGVRGSSTLVVVSLEKAGGMRPPPLASQTFELATVFVPQ